MVTGLVRRDSPQLGPDRELEGLPLRPPRRADCASGCSISRLEPVDRLVQGGAGSSTMSASRKTAPASRSSRGLNARRRPPDQAVATSPARTPQRAFAPRVVVSSPSPSTPSSRRSSAGNDWKLGLTPRLRSVSCGTKSRRHPIVSHIRSASRSIRSGKPGATILVSASAAGRSSPGADRSIRGRTQNRELAYPAVLELSIEINGTYYGAQSLKRRPLGARKPVNPPTASFSR